MNNAIPNGYSRYEIDAISIISSNATEDNLPGPGRTLGSVYSSIGKQLEGLLNTFAEKQRLGPIAVADRVRSRGNGPYNKKEAKSQRRDLKKLLGFVEYVKYSTSSLIVMIQHLTNRRSNNQSTLKQALESIGEVAQASSHIRMMLKSLSAIQMIKSQEDFIRNYCEPSVQQCLQTVLTQIKDKDPSPLRKSTPFFRRFFPHDIDIISISSPNITEDDRPGHGQVIENVYRSIGKSLEGTLSLFAESRGLGPKAVALRIHRREYNRLYAEIQPSDKI